MFSPTSVATALLLAPISSAQLSKYQPCPLLGPFFPPPQLDASSEIFQSAVKDFTKSFDQYVAAADGKYGPITPNKTSFSVAIFAGDNYMPKDGDDTPYLFEYHHAATAVEDESLDADSVFAIGDLTMVFTALMVLLEMGDEVWSRSIVEFIPELKAESSNVSVIEKVQWQDVTLGALAGHLAGIARSCKWLTSASQRVVTDTN